MQGKLSQYIKFIKDYRIHVHPEKQFLGIKDILKN